MDKLFGSFSASVLDDNINSWINFKSLFIEKVSPNISRVCWDTKYLTVSEGIGYAMIMSVSFNDKILFNELWRFYKLFLNGRGVMNWKVTSTDTVEQNGATDSEEDCAIALVMASNKWNSYEEFTYRTEAEYLIALIKEYEVEHNTYVIKPGDAWGGSDITNISYFAPAYYKVFGEFTNDIEFWNNVVDKCYSIIQLNQELNDSVGGLVSDWCKADGSLAPNMEYNHKYDATRTLWRIATDYAWYNDNRAESYCIKNNNWMALNGFPDAIRDGFSLDGNATGHQRNITFISSFACTTILDSSLQELFLNYMKKVRPDNYFDHCILILSILFLSGNFKI